MATTPEQVINTNPVLVEALANAAHCAPHDAAEHLAQIFDEGAHMGTLVAEFLNQYVPV